MTEPLRSVPQEETVGQVYRLKTHVVKGREYRDDTSRHYIINGSRWKRRTEWLRHRFDLPTADPDVPQDIYANEEYKVYRRGLLQPNKGFIEPNIHTGTGVAPRKATASMRPISLVSFALGSRDRWVITKPGRDKEGRPLVTIALPSRKQLRPAA